MHRLSLWASLFWGFFQVGVLGFGGGPGSVGVLQAVAVDTYRWLSPDQFAQALAVGNSLPGPLATKMAGWIGYRVAGWGGMVAGLLGVTLPSLVLMVGFFALIQRLRTNPWVAGALRGIQPVVAAILLLLVWQLVPKGQTTSLPVYAALGLAALLAMALLRLSPVWAVVGGMLAGALLLRPAS